MAFLSYFLQFKASADKKPSNSPSLSSMSWVRDVQGVAIDNQSSQVLTIPANGYVTVFTGANKKFAYVEADKTVDMTINGAAALSISPVVIGSTSQPGSFLINAVLTELIIANPSTTDEVTVFVASVE